MPRNGGSVDGHSKQGARTGRPVPPVPACPHVRWLENTDAASFIPRRCVALEAWVPIRAVIREPMGEAAHGDARTGRLMAADGGGGGGGEPAEAPSETASLGPPGTLEASAAAEGMRLWQSPRSATRWSQFPCPVLY